MNKITISESFNVGHSKIDAEHQDLIKSANEMITLQKKGDYVDCNKAFKNFSEKFDLHIVSEEAIMSEAGFPCSDLHLAQHKGAREKIKENVLRCDQRGSGCNNCIQDNVNGLLSHILMSDIDFKEFLYAKNEAAENARG